MPKPGRWADAIVLGFLALAPWHGLLSKVPLPLPAGGFFAQASVSGFVNLSFVLALLAALAPALIASFRARRPSFVEGALMAWVLLHFLNARRIDATSVVSLENVVLFSVLIALVLRRDALAGTWPVSGRIGFQVLLVSLASAVFLPMAVPVAGARIYETLGPIERYAGWSGTGAIGFCGIGLGIWSALRIAGGAGWKHRAWSLAGAAVGFVAIHVTVLRIGILTLAMVFCLAAFFTSGRQSRLSTVLLMGLAVVTAGSLLAPKVLKKSYLPPVEELFKESSAAKPPPPAGSLRERLMRYNGPSNGRVFLLFELLDASRGWELFGQGSGSSARFLRSTDINAKEPHNDYLRTYFDHGAAGLLLLAAIMVGLGWSLRHSAALSAFAAVAALMATDNIVIYPVFGYAPIFLAALFTAAKEGAPGLGDIKLEAGNE